MKMISLAEALSKANPHGVEAKTIYDHDHALISHLKLLPGEALKRHITPVDVAFYVLEGQGEVEIGEEKETVRQDTMVESPKGVPHLWRNIGTSPLRILVMKLPRPNEKTKLL
ncbi:MAG: cupin domain-containing protein [Methanomassiliicoccus sp.]|nr:cupin domain-containing protein [Methanomassiliicoccus sp.]